MIKNYIFLGAPGVGKGTMAKLLAERQGLVHVSTGEIFRENIKNETVLGKKIKKILASGGYVPDELTNAIVKKTLDSDEVKKSGFILDGYPRTEGQAKFLEDNNYNIHAVILLEADEKIIMDRILSRAKKENREDDTPEVVENRIVVYNKKTAPLIKHYNDLGLIRKVISQGPMDEIYANLEKAAK